MMIEYWLDQIPMLRGACSDDIKIKPLSGLTNQSYHICYKGTEYVLRIPTAETNSAIVRKNEIHNAQLAYQQGITAKTIWFDESSGLSLSSFLYNTHPLKSAVLAHEDILLKVAKTLKLLHSNQSDFLGITFNSNNLKIQISKYYKACCNNGKNKHKQQYQNTLEYLTELDNYSSNARNMVCSHMDLVFENILVSNDHQLLYFIDWEYSSMASPFWDIATFLNSATLTNSQIDLFLSIVMPDMTALDIQQLEFYKVISQCMTDLWFCSMS